MREFKFLTNNKRILFEGKEVVYVGYLLYNPESFDALRRVHLMDDGGRIDQIEINDTHPLWEEFRGIETYRV